MRLSAEDARILHLETELIAGHTCKVVELAQPLGVEALRAHVAGRIDQTPILARRLASGRAPAARPSWEADPSFELDRHIRPASGDGEVDRRRLPELVASALERRLPRDRPLWSIDVVERLSGGAAALVWLMHHAAADGATCERLAEAVLWDADGRPADTESSATGASAAPDRAPGRSRAALAELGRVPATLRRELAPLRAASPFDGPIGPRRTVAFARCPLDDLRRVARSVGGHVTLNDVVLAAVAGGVRAWLLRHGRSVGPMRAKVPVSMHPAHEEPDALGNRDCFLFVDLTTEEPDRVRRLLAINAETARRKAAHDPSTIYALLNDLTHVAPPLARAASRLAMSPRTFTFSVSNVRGPARPVAVAGAPVTGLWTLAEVAPRHAVRLSGVSSADDFAIGFTADPALVPDVAGLAAAVENEARALLAAVG